MKKKTEEALRSGPFINNSLIAVIRIVEDGNFSPDDDFDTGSRAKTKLKEKKYSTIKCTKICNLNCFNVGN
jgi:hypothetical protein